MAGLSEDWQRGTYSPDPTGALEARYVNGVVEVRKYGETLVLQIPLLRWTEFLKSVYQSGGEEFLPPNVKLP